MVRGEFLRGTASNARIHRLRQRRNGQRAKLFEQRIAVGIRHGLPP